MIKCPFCQQAAEQEKNYNMMVCKNSSCSFYLKDDVRHAFGAPNVKNNSLASSQTNTNGLHSLIDLVEEVMDNFDFNKTQEVMRYLNWTWASCNGVPSVGDLRAFVRHNLEKIIMEGRKKKEDASYNTGGFILRYFFEADFLEVQFVLTEWESCLPPKA